MRDIDKPTGTSVRASARYFRKFGRPPVVIKDPLDYIHPRMLRKPHCSCGYPYTECKPELRLGGSNWCAEKDG